MAENEKDVSASLPSEENAPEAVTEQPKAAEQPREAEQKDAPAPAVEASAEAPSDNAPSEAAGDKADVDESPKAEPKAASDAAEKREPRSARKKEPEQREAPAHSAFSGLAKLNLGNLPPGPAQPAPRPEPRREERERDYSREGRERRPERRDRRDDRREGRDRRDQRERREGTGRRPQPPHKGGRRFDERGRQGPRIESVLSATERTTQEEVSFAQNLLHALEAEIERFTKTIGEIEGLETGLREATETEMRGLLEHARGPLTRTLDGSAPLTIGVGGAPGVGKTTLIEALGAESGKEVGRDEEGKASTNWRGIRFVEMPTGVNVDGVIEVRMNGIEPVSVGRPLLAIDNVRVNLHDGFTFESFLNDPDSFLGARRRVPDDETPPRVHVLAFSLANRPEHKNKSGRLRDISRFDEVEALLARRLQNRARMLRVQGFLDNVIESVVPLRDFGLTVYLQSQQEARNWQTRMAEFKDDMAKWGENARKNVRENVAGALAPLRNQLEAFVNKHAGEESAGEQWNSRLEGLNAAEIVNREVERIEKEFRDKARSLGEKLKGRRQPGEGPLPQPILLTDLPQVFRDATSRFHARLREVSDMTTWITPLDRTVPELPQLEQPVPGDKEQLQAALTKHLDALRDALAGTLEERLVQNVLLAAERRLVTENRALIDSLLLLGREGFSTLEVANEVLLSMNQRLIERAAEYHRIRLPLIQKMVREPGHRTKLLVPPSRDLFPVARRLQDALGERVDLIPAAESPEARIATALLPAKLKPEMVSINEEKRMAQVRVPRKESGKAFGRNASNQRLASALTGYHLHLRISKEVVLEKEKKGAKPQPEAKPVEAPPETPAPGTPAATGQQPSTGATPETSAQDAGLTPPPVGAAGEAGTAPEPTDTTAVAAEKPAAPEASQQDEGKPDVPSEPETRPAEDEGEK